MWQVPPTASVCPWQSWEPPKSPAAPPASETTTGPRPTFFTVTCWPGDVFPTATLPKSNRVGDSVAAEGEREVLAVDRAGRRPADRPRRRRRELIADVAARTGRERLPLAVLGPAEDAGGA